MKKKIFLVEDDEDIREIVTLVLESEKYEVVQHATISEFERRIHEETPNAILLDIKLPDGNGMDLCASLKSRLLTKGIPVILMSAHEQLNVVMRRCEAESFISKPFDITDLLFKVKRYAL